MHLVKKSPGMAYTKCRINNPEHNQYLEVPIRQQRPNAPPILKLPAVMPLTVTKNYAVVSDHIADTGTAPDS